MSKFKSNGGSRSIGIWVEEGRRGKGDLPTPPARRKGKNRFDAEVIVRLSIELFK